MGIIINTAPMFHAQWSLLGQNEEQKIVGHIFNFNHYLWPFDKDEITSKSIKLIMIIKVMSEFNRLLDFRL